MCLFTEIPGPTIKNTSPATKKEDYKYSTPIEGPDNQFGSADRSDDEDERENIDDVSSRTPSLSKIENITKNKTHSFLSTNTMSEQKISNKIRKIFEIDEFNVNRSCRTNLQDLVYYFLFALLFYNYYRLDLSLT